MSNKPKGRRLPEEAVLAGLQELPQWDLRENKLCRALEFADFQAAFAFMTRVAELAEEANHHPWWSNFYGSVRMELWSHDVDGISQRDFDLAAAIEKVVLLDMPQDSSEHGA